MTKEVKILVAIAALIVIGAFAISSFYRNSTQTQSNTAGSSPRVTPIPAENLVRPDSPKLGSDTAVVTVVEFIDPECESCAAFAPMLKKAISQYGDKTRLVIRYMPLHPNSVAAANLIESAGEQGKYWEMFDLLLAKQSEWGTRHGPATTPQPDAKAMFMKYAGELGLDKAKVEAAINENKFGPKIDRDRADGQAIGVRQTPTIFVNGRKLLRLGEAEVKALINDELKKIGG
jgi:protein-disulfide isomerase